MIPARHSRSVSVCFQTGSFNSKARKRLPSRQLMAWLDCIFSIVGFLIPLLLGFYAEICKSGATSRLKLEQLPGYAAELNPDEGIWKHLKCVELKNLCCQSLAQLRVELRKAKERLRHKKHVILGCIRQPGFEL
jgi:hypothetical protein